MSESTREPREAWSEVGRRFEELGRALREHFDAPDSATWRAADATDAGTAGVDAPGGGTAGSGTAGAGAAGTGETADDASRGRAAVQDAVQRMTQAVQRLGDQASEAVRDPAVRDTAQQAARTLGDALETTFGQLGEQLRSRVGSARGADQAGSERPPARPAAPPEIIGADAQPPPTDDDRPAGTA